MHVGGHLQNVCVPQSFASTVLTSMKEHHCNEINTDEQPDNLYELGTVRNESWGEYYAITIF